MTGGVLRASPTRARSKSRAARPSMDVRDGRSQVRGATHCSGHVSQSSDPMVAHCITGALRTLPEPRVFSSLRENLIDPFSRRHRVFVVVGFDCRVGTEEYLDKAKAASAASCAKDYSTAELDRALAFIGAESFEVMPNRAPPTVACTSSQSQVDRFPGYWLQTEKTRRCIENVERYEQETGVCFDWIVRSRPDDFWKSRAPRATSLPRDVVTTGQMWSWFVPLQHWNRTKLSAMEDHFMAAPRQLANAALKRAVDKWFDCRSLPGYERVCPGSMLYYMKRVNISTKAMMTSECLLGLHLRERGVRWRTDPRFAYMMRRVPGGDTNNSYSQMLASFTRSSWTYQELERAVQRHRWGEELELKPPPPPAAPS